MLTTPPRRSTGSSSAATLQQRLGNRGLASLLKPGHRGLHPELLRAMTALDLPETSPQADEDPSPALDLAYTPEAYLSMDGLAHIAMGLQLERLVNRGPRKR